jgi:hypothetical protein
MGHPAVSGRHVAALDQLRARGFYLDFYDPDGSRYGLPTYPYHYAPRGLLTRRQLCRAGLRPAGQPITAQIIWRHRGRPRIAYLYRADQAAPKRQATPAQLAAIAAALRARRTCPACGTEKPYYIPRSLGECLDCAPEGGR